MCRKLDNVFNSFEVAFISLDDKFIEFKNEMPLNSNKSRLPNKRKKN